MKNREKIKSVLVMFGLFLLFSDYSMEKEEAPFEVRSFRKEDIDFLAFLKKGVKSRFFEIHKGSWLEVPYVYDEVYDFFHYYIERFEDHFCCLKKCIGEEKNDERAMITTKKNEFPRNDFRDCSMKYYTYPHHICQNTKKEDLTLKFYDDNKKEMLLGRFTLINEENPINHAKCKKQPCVNLGLTVEDRDYNDGLFCHMMSSQTERNQKCHKVVGWAEGFIMGEFKENVFSPFIKTIDENRCKIDLLGFYKKYPEYNDVEIEDLLKQEDKKIEVQLPCQSMKKKVSPKKYNSFFSYLQDRLSLHSFQRKDFLGKQQYFFGFLGLGLGMLLNKKKNYTFLKKSLLPVSLGTGLWLTSGLFKHAKRIKNLPKRDAYELEI